MFEAATGGQDEAKAYIAGLPDRDWNTAKLQMQSCFLSSDIVRNR